MVDHNYLFRDVRVGWPGNVHDARVLANCQLYWKVKNGEVLNTNSIQILGTEVFSFLIGDSAYPLSTWLIKPFLHNSTLISKQRTFNYIRCRARIVSENAFGRLKARWRRLLKQNDMDVTKVPQVVLACCIHNNVCEIHGDIFNTTRLNDILDEQPTITPSSSTSHNTQATVIRDNLVQRMT